MTEGYKHGVKVDAHVLEAISTNQEVDEHIMESDSHVHMTETHDMQAEDTTDIEVYKSKAICSKLMQSHDLL